MDALGIGEAKGGGALHGGQLLLLHEGLHVHAHLEGGLRVLGGLLGLLGLEHIPLHDAGDLEPDLLPTPEGAELTQAGYEYYPQGLEHVIRAAAADFKGELFVTRPGRPRGPGR